MRYKFNEISPSGHRQYSIALNIRELELLRGMAVKLLQDLPEVGPTARLHQVARTMSRSLGEAIREAEKLEDNGKRVHLFPIDNNSVL